MLTLKRFLISTINIFFVIAVSMLFGCQTMGNLAGQTPADRDESAAGIVDESDDLLADTQNPSDTAELDFFQLETAHQLPQPIHDYLHATAPLPYHGDFPLSEHPRVTKKIYQYSVTSKKMFGKWLERAGRYIPKIQMVFADEGVPLDLAYLAMIESGFNVRAYSWAHAAGPWQFIEGTGKLYGLSNDWWQDGRLDIESSTRAAAKHLKYLHKRFDGDWYLAVAAYNAGGGKVRKAVRASGSRDFWTLTDGRVLREETKNYLPKLLAALNIVKNLDAYGFSDLNFYQPLEYETVTVETSTDLEIIARFCGISYRELKELNPALKRWCTPPGVHNYPVHVPFGTASEVRSLYAQLPKEDRAHYHRHQIKSGDTLQVLARKYRIRVDDIIALNHIKDPRALQIGQNLILPLKAGYTHLPVNSMADSYVRSRRKIYRVRSGDSLWSISRKFGVTQKQLRVWNKLGWSNILRPGQILAVSRPGARTVAKAKVKHKKGPSRQLIYKVVPGDTLWGIGRQFDVATEEIRRWNNLSAGHVLQPGQKLTLNVAVSRRG